MKIFSSILNLGLGFERLCFFLVSSLVLMHITACLWIILPEFDNDELGAKITFGSWLEKYQK